MVKKFISIIATFIFTACLFAVISPSPASAGPGWWDISWTCRKSIIMTELSGSTLTNYQIKVDLSYESAMKADFSDVRFIDSDNTSLLPHWCESYVPSSSAIFWVKIPSLPASDSVIISMYYGNPAASSASNGDATFEFFDDFEDGDISDWSQYNSGTVQIADDGGNYVILKTANNDPNGGYSLFNNGALSDCEVILRTKRINENGGSQNRYGIEDGSFNGYGPRMYDFNASSATFAIERRTGGSSSNLVTKATSAYEWNTWMTVKFRKYGSNLEFELYNSSGGLAESISTTNTQYSSFDRFVIHGGWEYYTDDIRVRNYVNPEPSCSIGIEEVLIPPAVTTGDATNIGIDAVQLNGGLDNLGTATSADVSFEWGVTPGGPYSNETLPETMNSTGNFTFDLSSLSPSTTHYFRAKAVGLGTGYGVEKSFTTLTLPTATTSNASNIGIDAAQLNGSLDNLGTAASADVSFEWGVTTGGPYPNETTPETVNATGNFSFDLSSLTPGTTYYFRAKADGHGTGYGVEKSFTTLTLPMVTTNDAGNVDLNSAQLNGSLDDLGTATSTDICFEWGVTPGGSYPNETTPETVNVTGVFSFDLSSLTPSTTYYYRAKAVGHGTAYGTEKNFTTLTLATVTTGDATNTGIDTTRLNGSLDDLGTATSANVSFEWGVTPGGPYPNETTSETVNATGNFIFDLSSLTPGTTYYFRAKAVGHGTGYGAEKSFTTNSYYVEYVEPPPVHHLDINALGLEKSFNIDSTGKLLETIDVPCSDGTINIYIAKGTVVRDEQDKPLRTLEICAAESPPGLPSGTCQLGSACTFLPGGTTFDPSMTITWRYNPDTLPDETHEEELFIAYYDESIGRWICLDGVVDTLNNTVTAEVSHFTTFALLGIESRPASFTVHNLMITPDTVNQGEIISVSVSVANTGDFTGSYSIALEIDDEVINTKQIILHGGTHEAVVFELSKETIGSHSVDVNGLSGSFVVEAVEVEVAEIETVQQTSSSSAPTSPESTTVSISPAPKDYTWLLISSIALALLLGLVMYFLVIRPRMV